MRNHLFFFFFSDKSPLAVYLSWYILKQIKLATQRTDTIWPFQIFCLPEFKGAEFSEAIWLECDMLYWPVITLCF